jgi:hypothetical protein
LKPEQAIALPPSLAPELVSATQSTTAQATSADNTQAIAKPPEPDNVIDLQKRLQEKNQVEFFEQQLQLAEQERPKLIAPRRARRSR